MIAYISYSIDESEQYVLTLLAQKLKEKGFSLTSGVKHVVALGNPAFGLMDFQTENEIKKSNLFIGLITNSYRYNSSETVYQELQKAREYNKPIILLIEDTAPIDIRIANFPNLVRFNRYLPHLAIEEVKNRIQLSQTQPQEDNTLGWLLAEESLLLL
jgi:hypothetical protein